MLDTINGKDDSFKTQALWGTQEFHSTAIFSGTHKKHRRKSFKVHENFLLPSHLVVNINQPAITIVVT